MCCRVNTDAWLHSLPAAALARLVVPRLRLLTAVTSAVATSMDRCVQISTVPTQAAKYAIGTKRFWIDSDDPGVAAPLERTSIKLALDTIRTYADRALKANPSFQASAVQALLPKACKAVPMVRPAQMAAAPQ